MNRPMVHLLLFVQAVAFGGCAPSPLQQDTHVVRLGDDEVSLVVHTSPEPGHRYVVLHDDENTAIEAALEIVRERGGRLIELQHSGERNVRFRRDGMEYRFDPNRMFTARGVASTLDRWSNAPIDASVVAEVQALADTVLSYLTEDYEGLLVAVHNNTADAYSVLSYQPGGDLAAEARFVHVASGEDVDDFFFATDDSVYNRVIVAGFHAVLQRVPAATDDGSLSVYAAEVGLPYVNVEAEHGHMEQQLKMLEAIAATP